MLDGGRHVRYNVACGASCAQPIKYVLKFPCNRGGSGALYLQSAIAGVLSCLGSFDKELPFISGVDIRVLRNRNL